MRDAIAAVKAFHDKMGVSGRQLLTDCIDREVTDALHIAGEQLLLISRSLEYLLQRKDSVDRRALRAHLPTEELGELLLAFAERDERRALDAFADLLYVLFGGVITFDLPLAEAFAEVHSSNLTKTPQPSDPSRARVRSKGPDYRPPDIARVLAEYRDRKTGRLPCAST